MIELDASLHPELVPLSWLIGSWEGVGVVGYADTPEKQFGQRIDFVAHEVTYDDERKTVYRKGEGPGVIVISEIPGITPAVADFARRVVDLGCTVAMPSLFGDPGRPISTGYAASSLLGACVSKEFATMAMGRT